MSTTPDPLRFLVELLSTARMLPVSGGGFLMTPDDAWWYVAPETELCNARRVTEEEVSAALAEEIAFIKAVPLGGVT